MIERSALAGRVTTGNSRRGREEYQFMDKDRIAGAAHEVKGVVKEAMGKAVGDAKLQSDGQTEKAAGKSRMPLAA